MSLEITGDQVLGIGIGDHRGDRGAVTVETDRHYARIARQRHEQMILQCTDNLLLPGCWLRRNALSDQEPVVGCEIKPVRHPLGKRPALQDVDLRLKKTVRVAVVDLLEVFGA